MILNGARDAGLLIVGHGETIGGGVNAGMVRLVEALRARKAAPEVRCGFIRGAPSIPEAVSSFATARVIVYPMFFSEGYFVRQRIPELLAEGAEGRTVTILKPLGLAPELPMLVAKKAREAAIRHGDGAEDVSLVLIAHGSAKDASSRLTTEMLADRIGAMRAFPAVHMGFIEEPPSPQDVLARVRGPAVVVGLFSGDGLHGCDDIARFFDRSGRSDLIWAGNVGAWPELADLVAGSGGLSP